MLMGERCQGENRWLTHPMAAKLRSLQVLALAHLLIHPAVALTLGDVTSAAQSLIHSRGLQQASRIQLPELSVGTFPFADIEVSYQMYDSPLPPPGEKEKGSPVILFLHGMRFTSDIWMETKTLEVAWRAGYTAIAVDLPGYGKTKHLPYVDNNMRAEFVKAALEFARRGVNMTSILVSPSMSGKWAIPFLDRYGLMLAGWAPVAPVGVKQWGGPWEYTHRQVVMWVFYGDSDPMKEDAVGLCRFFAQSKTITIKDAGHACYVDQPAIFHGHLKDFLRTCKPDLAPRNFIVEDGL